MRDSDLFILCLGFLLDLLLGDPHSIPHPVCLIGRLITECEKRLRRSFKKTPVGEFIAGAILSVIVMVSSMLVPFLLLVIAKNISIWLFYILSIIMSYQILATKSLKTESMKVYDALQEHDIEKARYAVSMIVGRDTENLDEKQITRACVETIAENTSDGVIAPLIYLFLGGPLLGFLYKAISTMDSMIAYRNETYLYFGRIAARLDDIANFIPARISALLMILAAGLNGMSMKHAWKIFCRDRYKHKSPNSAQTESVCAGALGVRLAGDAYYHGVLCKKDNIGDALREIEINDIKRANRLLYTTAFLCLILGILMTLLTNMLIGGLLC